MLKPSNQLGRGKSPVARKFSPRTHRKVENTAAIWISMKGTVVISVAEISLVNPYLGY